MRFDRPAESEAGSLPRPVGFGRGGWFGSVVDLGAEYSSRLGEAAVGRLRRWGPVGEAGEDGVESLDARLLPGAVSCWGVTIAVLTVGWRAGIAITVVSIAVAAVVGWVVRKENGRSGSAARRGVAGVVLAALLLGAGFAVAAAWREFEVVRHPLRAAVGGSVSVVVTPVDDPKAVRGRPFGGQRLYVVRAGLDEFRRADGTVRAGGTVVILGQGERWRDVLPGRSIEFRAQVEPARYRDLTVVALQATGPPRAVGGLPWWQRAASSVRADLSAASRGALSERAAGVLPALVVGDTSALSDSVRADFDTAGLQHICVVSGANFTIVLSMVLFAVRLLGLGPRVAATAAMAVLPLFVIVARPDPSVLRAAAMGAITALALFTGRRRQALPALCAAVIGLLAWHPELAVSAGFALSVVATAGLILLAPSWADWLLARGWWRLPAEITAVSAAAFVVTTPIVVALSGTVSTIAILANVLAEPVIAPITVIGATAAAVAWLLPSLAEIMLHAAAPPMWWLLTVAENAAAAPGASVQVPGGTAGGAVAAALTVALIVGMRSSTIRRWTAAAVLGCSVILIPVQIRNSDWPPWDLTSTPTESQRPWQHPGTAGDASSLCRVSPG